MRRRAVRWIATGLALGTLAAACGSDDGGSAGVGDGEGDAVDLMVLTEGERDEPDATADPTVAGQAIEAFGIDLFTAVAGAAGEGNVLVSPTSVAIALALAEPGATGAAGEQLRSLLRIDDPDAFHAAMSALEQSLEARVAEALDETDDPGEVRVRIANAGYLQRDFPFERTYLDRIARVYGPVLSGVDFETDPDAVAREINRFVAEATEDRITDLVPDGALHRDMVLALVNALYLKASWQEVFDAGQTRDGPFTRLDGSEVDVPLMRGLSSASARGDGWVAATKRYQGGLAMQVVLPDEGRFDEVAGDLASVLAEAGRRATSGAELVMPRFETRFSAELSPALTSLGLTAPYREGGLLGIAEDPRLVLDQVIHEVFVAVDEEGTEAAAATVALFSVTSGPIEPPVPVVLDRPFLFRIIDEQTGATLFLGQIVDPTEA